MPTFIEELLIGVGYKTDTKSLEDASKKARAAAKDAEEAFEDASKKVGAAQDAVAEAADKASKKQAQSALRAAKKTAKAARDSMLAAKTASKEAGTAARDAATQADKSSKEFRDRWVKRTKTVSIAAAGLATAFVAGLGKIAHDTIEASIEFDRWSKTIDSTSEELQRLDLIAESVNVETDNMREGVKTLRENLGELARIGTGPAKAALGSLGIQLEEIKDLRVEDQLGFLADALVEVEDPAKQLSIAIEIMGEDGAKLLPILQRGSEGIRELGIAADESGRIMSDELVESTLDLDQTLKKTTNTTKAAVNQIGVALVPVLTDAAEGVNEWVGENEEFIRQDLPAVLTSIAKAVGLAAEGFAAAIGVVSDFGDATGRLGERLSGKVIEVQLAWAIATGEISLETANAVRAGLDKPAVGRGGAPLVSEPPPAPTAPATPTAPEGPRPGAATRARRRGRFEREELAKAGGGGSANQRKAEEELAAALAQVRLSGLEEDLRGLGLRSGASEKAIDASIKAAAEQFAKGASRRVARKAGTGALSSLTGVDVGARQTDPILSAIFGDDALPDVPLSELERGQQPQVLISTINNTYNVEVTTNVDGARDPLRVAESVSDQFRNVLSNEVAAASKMSKVLFAR